jgi:hypothetical protein
MDGGSAGASRGIVPMENGPAVPERFLIPSLDSALPQPPLTIQLKKGYPVPQAHAASHSAVVSAKTLRYAWRACS